MKQKKQINKDQYKHYLIDTVEILTKENGLLQEQLNQLQTEYNILFNDWRIDRMDDPNDCYKCICGKVSECNCYHLGLHPPKILTGHDRNILE